jgi:hypothetical protein
MMPVSLTRSISLTECPLYLNADEHHDDRSARDRSNDAFCDNAGCSAVCPTQPASSRSKRHAA